MFQKYPSIFVCKACPLEGAQGSCFLSPRVPHDGAAHPAQVILSPKTTATVREFEVPPQRGVGLRQCGPRLLPQGMEAQPHPACSDPLSSSLARPGIRKGTGKRFYFCLSGLASTVVTRVSLSRKFPSNSESFKTQGGVYGLWLSKPKQQRKERPSSMI